MSSTLSVAAVTAALRNRLTVVSSPLAGRDHHLSDTQVADPAARQSGASRKTTTRHQCGF